MRCEYSRLQSLTRVIQRKRMHAGDGSRGVWSVLGAAVPILRPWTNACQPQVERHVCQGGVANLSASVGRHAWLYHTVLQRWR